MLTAVRAVALLIGIAGSLVACCSGGSKKAAAATTDDGTPRRDDDRAAACRTRSPACPSTDPATNLAGPDRSSSRSTTPMARRRQPRARSPGLNQADVVYEEMVEGSVTRLAAIFQSKDRRPASSARCARSDHRRAIFSREPPAVRLVGRATAVSTS